ncbi:MAG TPA: sigma-70 family RNA polymerase sigma factor [Bacteroidia bacterium]|nr:sigma-70 family RNA polymerase sigma factor [Bacteroidia bacterium]
MSTLEFNKQVLNFKSALGYFALSLTSNTEDAKDLLQDTIMKALVYKDKFTDATNLKAWLYTIMKNTFINNYRKAIKVNQVIDNTKDLYFMNIPQNSGVSSPVSQISMKDINFAIESLNDDLRVPFKMFFEGYKYKEIADQFNLPIGTVKSRIFLARKQLMHDLKDFR